MINESIPITPTNIRDCLVLIENAMMRAPNTIKGDLNTSLKKRFTPVCT